MLVKIDETGSYLCDVGWVVAFMQILNEVELLRQTGNVMKNAGCAMVRGRDDFQRAMDNMEPDSDEEMSGSHGEATTEDGWTIYLSEYGSYPKAMKDTTEMKIPLFCVILTNVAVDEDMPPGAQAEYNRQMGEAIEKGKKVRKELGLDP